MGSDSKLLTADTKGGWQADPVTGSDLPGSKRGLDMALPAHDPYINLVMLALIGWQPEPVYDSVVRVNTSSTQVDYHFNLNSSIQFKVEVTNIDTAYPTATVTVSKTLTLENGTDLLLTEAGDELLKES